MPNPKISVIIPIYNVEPYLDETFTSLLNQSFKDYEIIVVNDGSTDDSDRIVRKYQATNPCIKYYQQANQGQSAARNLAMQYAQGEYIYFMDADDVMKPEALEQCYEYIQRTQADFIFFDGEVMYEKGASPITWGDYHRTHLVKEYQKYAGNFLLNLMLDHWKHSCVVWLLMIRKSYINRIQLNFYNGIIHEDELYTTLLTLQSNNIFALQKSLVKHRIRKDSTMGKRYSKRNINCYLTVFDELFKFQDSPLIRKFAAYTLSKVFYTGHSINLKDKFSVFIRALKSGYLKYIGFKSTLVFWLKP